jgi:hypothetical protein
MLELTFREFYEDKYATEESHDLYVMMNGLGEVL